MILAPHTLPEEVAFVLEQAITALQAAAKDGSPVALAGLAEVQRCMGYIGYPGGHMGDIEVQADFEAELQAMYAEVNAEEFGEGDSLPPIIVDSLPVDFWGEAA
jgi:hypothetical protein